MKTNPFPPKHRRAPDRAPRPLVLDDVTLDFDGRRVLEHFSFTLPAGETAVIMGGSGSGKTSILRLLARLIPPTSGRVDPGTDRISMQFQEPRLLPTRTAAENVNAVLSDTRRTLPEAAAWLRRVGLEQAVDLYPAELSGGMAQRAALCRALAADADLILLDEPFRGLDEGTRADVMALVREETAGRTLILVTHDEEEAAFFGGKLIRL